MGSVVRRLQFKQELRDEDVADPVGICLTTSLPQPMNMESLSFLVPW